MSSSLALIATVAMLLVATALLLWSNRRMRREAAVRARLSAERMEGERRFRFLAENTADVIWTMDIAGERFTYVSPSVARLRGLTPEEVVAQPVSAAFTPESTERLKTVLAASLARWHAGGTHETVRVTDLDQPHRDGRVVPTEAVTSLHADAAGRPVAVLGVSRDITERRRAEASIRVLAFHDPLTQLPNRRLLLDRLEVAIAAARRNRWALAVMFIDLDRFKPINDRLGHETGDWLLREAAGRMQGGIRASDTVARFGGDEFVVLLPVVRNEFDARSIAEKIRNVLHEPFVTPDGERLDISSSIGIALYPWHGDSVRALLKCADDAMYRAKQGGRDRVVLCQADPRDELDVEPGGDDPAGVTMRLQWKAAFACGDPVIDRQHRELFRLANGLINAVIRKESGSCSFDEAFEQLRAHTVRHVADEEAILARAEYPGLEEHAHSHRQIIEGIERARADAGAGRIGLGELVEFLVHEVIAGHLLKEDRKFYARVSAARQACEDATDPGEAGIAPRA